MYSVGNDHVSPLPGIVTLHVTYVIVCNDDHVHVDVVLWNFSAVKCLFKALIESIISEHRLSVKLLKSLEKTRKFVLFACKTVHPFLGMNQHENNTVFKILRNLLMNHSSKTTDWLTD
jgi:hypothetical protein